MLSPVFEIKDRLIICIDTENGFGAHDLGVDALSRFSHDAKKRKQQSFGKAH